MAKRNSIWSNQKLNAYINQGRGQGELENYKPWTTIQDFSSMGRATRIKGWKTNRIHHLQSDIMLKYFYLLEWENNVIDIRESFPLVDLYDEIGDNEDLSFNRFKDKLTNEPYVLTTSFLITINKEGKNSYIARSIKNSYELEKKSSLEKLEIERRYWKKQKIDWAIVTEKEIPIEKTKNIEWIHSSLFGYKDIGIDEGKFYMLCRNFIKDIIDNNHVVIREIINNFENNYKIDFGIGIFILKYLIANKILIIDISKKIDLDISCSSFIKDISSDFWGDDINDNKEFSL